MCNTIRYERDLLDDEPRQVSGVRGVKSRYFTRRFKNARAMEQWLGSDDVAGDVDVYTVERVS